MTETFFPCVIPSVARCVGVLDALCIHDQQPGLCATPQFLAGRANLDFFKARSNTLIPSWSGRLHLAKYECTVTSFGELPGQHRPLAARAQQVQCRTKHFVQVQRRGLRVRLRTLCSGGQNFFKLFFADVTVVGCSHGRIFSSPRIVDTFLRHGQLDFVQKNLFARAPGVQIKVNISLFHAVVRWKLRVLVANCAE